MLPQSLRANIYIFFLAIAVQLGAIGANLYYQNRGDALEATYLALINAEAAFLETAAAETGYFALPVSKHLLEGRYRPVVELIASENLGLDVGLLEKRESLLAALAALKGEQEQLHLHINSLLPNLSTSVQYIHEHHIAYLKNLLRRNKALQDYDTGAAFARSPAHSAPELDIIHAAISIQIRMLETFEVFSRLQRGYSPNDVMVDFTETIDAFYEAINTFEDYSLDAQDGLLVEELLLNGQTFEDSYKRFIALEQSQVGLNGQLNENRDEFIAGARARERQINSRYKELDRQITTVRYVSLAVSGLMLGALLFIGKRILDAFQRTVQETRRLQDNLDYRIPDTGHRFNEFDFIFRSLNAMADTISRQVRQLEQSQSMLEERVASRTRELSEANRKLLAEIKDRIRSGQERRELEEKLTRAQKMEALGTLAGGVAHDLNNILSGIVSYPDLILMDLEKDHPMRGPLTTIKASGEKAAVIVQDLLTLARRGVSRPEPIYLNQVVEAFMDSPEYRDIVAVHPDVSVECRLGPDIGRINGSQVHLSKSIMNLFSNAAEAINGSGTIRIETSRCYMDAEFKGYDNIQEGEYVKLTVGDTGVGITEEDRKRIFEPFFTTKTMGRSGSGLGMAVVWGTVKDHGGFIDVRSQVDAGTTFDLYFPLCRNIADLPECGDTLACDTGRGETVLVVDDVAEQREIASLMLERLGYRVETADCGEAALAHVATHPVDILLLDMVMPPGIDGLETYRQIVERRPGMKAVIASGYSENEKVNQAQELGAGPYIKKPYTMLELAAMVRFELDKK